MGRAYAGVLGFLAFAATLARGIIDSQESAATFLHACLALAGFAVLGALAGMWGESAVLESVEQNLRVELEAQEQQATNENRSRR